MSVNCFVRTKSDRKIYNLGDCLEQRLRFAKIVLNIFEKDELEFLIEDNLSDKECSNSLWIPSVFGYMYDENAIKNIEPLTLDEYNSYFKYS